MFRQPNPCSNHEIRMLFEHGFYLKILKWALVCLHDVTRQGVAARNEYFAYAFVDVNVASGNDVFDVRFCSLRHFVQKGPTYEIPLLLCLFVFPVFLVRF